MTWRNPFEPPRLESGAGSPHDSALLDALFAGTPVGLAFWDGELRYRRVNDVLAAINGRPAADHIGRTVGEVLPELGPGLEAMLAEILATGEPQLDRFITGETPAAPGVNRHWLASYFPVRGEDGEPAGVAATVVETTGERDATVRASRAERRGEEIDAQLRAVYSALPVGVAFVSPDLRYERVNEALAQMNGLPVEAHIGRTVHEVLGEHGDAAERLTREVIARGEPMEIELAVRTPASPGVERSFEATYFPVFAPEGLLGVGAVVRDVSDRRAAERERDELLREANAARRRATFLATVTSRLAASMDYTATLREVVSSAVPYLADWGVVSVVEPHRVRLLAFAHRDPERERLAADFARRYRPGPGSSVTRTLETGEPVVVTDVTAEQLALIAPASEYQELFGRLGIRHFASWPIRAPDGSIIGALSLVLGDSGRRFAPDDLQIARTVATRAGLHLANARLYSERTEIARTLQASLLPRELPAIPGADLAAAFLPAGDENIVGGDFYDVFHAGEGVWAAILGDVSGKGAQAAAITAAARHTLRAAAMIDPDPAANLTLLNRVLVADLAPSQFCTAVYARLCPSDDGIVVRLANGGHPPALVLRADGTVEPVAGGTGPLIGILVDAEFAETEVRLAPGELLLLHTDGVTEVADGGILLGERELRATLAARRGEPAAAVVEAVTAAALRLQRGTPRDDIAVLAIRAGGQPRGA